MSQRWVLDWSLALLTMSYAVGCTEAQPERISLGADYCDHCKMQITDGRFGGSIITKFGKALKYDSVECLAQGYHSHSKDVEEVFVADFKTQQLRPLNKINLYRNDAVRGPMGTKIQGLSNESSLPRLQFKELVQ